MAWEQREHWEHLPETQAGRGFPVDMIVLTLSQQVGTEGTFPCLRPSPAQTGVEPSSPGFREQGLDVGAGLPPSFGRHLNSGDRV